MGAYVEHYLGRHPAHSVIFASYSANLANKRSRMVRNEIAGGRAFQGAFAGVELAQDAQKVTEWQLGDGGGFIAAGVGGSITGFGANLGVIDDPLKGRKQAESARVREGVIDWFKGDFFTRLEPDAILIIIQTRWHKADLTGWLLEHKDEEDFGDYRWKLLSLPALAEEDDPLGRQAGEALWPERWPRGKLEANRNLLGDYDFASLYQQRPYLKGGSVFSDQVKRCETPPDLLGARIVVFADLAASVKTSADHSAFTVLATWGEAERMHAKVVEVRRGRWPINRVLAEMRELQQVYNQPIYVESSPNAIPVIQQARLEGLRVIPVKIEGDKFSGAQPWARAWNTGRVGVPFAPWATAYISEHASFKGDGGDEEDDQVDASAGAWRMAQRGAAHYGVEGASAG